MHEAVLSNESVACVDPHPGRFIVDGTAGAGGHTRALLGQMKGRGTLLAIDGDADSLERTAREIRAELRAARNRVTFIAEHGNFADVQRMLAKHLLPKANGFLLDLGFSSDQLDAGKGLSFLRDEPLDMRYGIFAGKESAADIVNGLSETRLEAVLREFGEERYARQIASAIVWKRRTRPFTTTTDLVEVVMHSLPRSYERGRIHPATRTFQALRIAVNRELENLAAVLGELPAVMARGGRVVVISFHSLEDRLVKQSFKGFVADGRAIAITKKPVVATLAERRANPRSRSAKLRAIQFS
jgi:16S rRNA (cytosine1402-N4)-methyltransferase